MNQIQAYSDILQLRTTFKRLQQLSWTISKLEQKYDIDALNEEELIQLAGVYRGYTSELQSIYDELKDEPHPNQQE